MIDLEHVGKVYHGRQGSVHAVGDVSLTIGEGEFLSIVGPSGCGKSTLLNMIAGFLPPSAGQIRVDGQPVHGQVPPRLGYIFQKDTLLPWYTVSKNVALGLRFMGVPAARIAPRVQQLLALGHLEGFAQAYPHQLSGGMRRRVALLMSLAVEPRILLLDEPFGALDTHTKTHLHRELGEIWRNLGQTIVMVTHDLDEAITLSDRVVVLSGPPSRVLLDERIAIPHPRDVFTLRETPEFTAHVQSLWAVLGQQFRAAA
ncbi:ABC transporter ATP-binding protein [Bordetella pseudohinzii]|uniref:ABC transporter ATP-binding protein n=1 Tax=Bordetella pseudohinzii TaxID=1331258 RepID=A0A0J6C7D4_9BORD|nr:ABC transporter ATP-binding protein [Bordetella pseudohinzii]ANY14458.1 ABC transporter ATP-binding protein [Bordetella pseudohinzii]KMM26636.1 ABC transporter ATP-binding protein [Bordetella pseudohinzii]KXA79178.1 ABC transporter ATP-binding protein [Bordetella pseudohinzii]KXA80993.1 ABC transporter ATP-binding protein [Bordetella pseudohinzii]CUI64927.1 Bicarbonate transport ATP-binding protein CmpD [Bordetella pseudohinzii]